MPILDSELNDAGVFQLVPKANYNGSVIACEIKATSSGKGTMANLDWQIVNGPNGNMEFAGRKIRFDNIMLAGKSKDDKPLALSQLCSFIYHTGMPWQCKSCGTAFDEVHSFLIATKDDEGLKPGNYYCKNCRTAGGIIFDTDHFMNQRCGITVGQKKGDNTDKEFNTITAYLDWMD